MKLENKTAEDVAKYLVDEFLLIRNEFGEHIALPEARQCAQKSVDLVIFELSKKDGNEQQIRFYKSVKHQITLI